MAAQAGSDGRCGIGTRLRAGREKMGLTVLQAAERLHLDPSVLKSMESDDFAAVGAPVYVRGHLRHYAELVGESPTELGELYSSSIRTAQPDLTQIITVQPPDNSSRLVVPALFVLGAFALAGAVWWVLSLSGQQAQMPRAVELEPPSAVETAPTPETAVPAPEPGPAVHTVAATRVAKAGVGTPGRAASNAAVPAPNSAAPKALAAPSAPATTSTPALIPTSLSPPSQPGSQTPQRSREAEVTLRFSADSWTEVYDASGGRLFYDVGAADSAHTVKGAPPLRVVLGNAAGVAVAVNGHDAPIDKLTQPDGSAQFVVSRSGRVSGPRP